MEGGLFVMLLMGIVRGLAGGLEKGEREVDFGAMNAGHGTKRTMRPDMVARRSPSVCVALSGR